MKGTRPLKIKHVLISFLLIILSLSLVFCSAPEKLPTEQDILTSGYWYNEDKSACFKFEGTSKRVKLYSLNSGSYTYNFGNVLEGSYSLDECTVTFGEDIKYYVLDGYTMTLGDEKLTLDTENVPTLNKTPMESATELALGTPMTLIPSNPGINEKIYLKFTPENDGKYLFDFEVSDTASKQRSIGDSGTTYIWILNSDFIEVASGVDDLSVSLSSKKTYYVIATVSAVSSDTGTNTLTVTLAQ